MPRHTAFKNKKKLIATRMKGEKGKVMGIMHSVATKEPGTRFQLDHKLPGWLWTATLPSHLYK